MAKTFSRRDDARPAVAGVSLSVAPGEVFGIIGESGAGKSTLIRLINLLERPTAGQVRIDGRDLGDLSVEELRAHRRRIGMIFQHFNLLSSQTVAQNVAFPLRLEGHLPRRDLRARVLRLLGRFGLEPLADRYPSELSGGQKQRVGIARALACEPTILLCDEPTSALDPETTGQILALLDELNRELGLTIVIITHEMDVVRRVCDRVAVLDHGAVVETGDVADVFLNAEHPATRRLLREDATPPPAAAGARTFRLSWRGEVAHVPFLSQVSRETGVDLRLQAARVAEVKGEPYGQLTLSMAGGEVAAAVAALEAAGVRVLELSL